MKNTKMGTFYYIVAILFFLCSIVECFLKLGDYTTYIWLGLGFVFFYLAEQERKKLKNGNSKNQEKKDDKDDKDNKDNKDNKDA